MNECESVVFDEYDYKCIIDNNKFKLSICSCSKGALESFIPNNPSYYCEEDTSDGNCESVLKDCEEMLYDLCDKWDEILKKAVIFQKKNVFKGKIKVN